jgi:hypothetical protein
MALALMYAAFYPHLPRVMSVGKIFWISYAMKRSSGIQKQVKTKDDGSVRSGLVPMMFEVTPEVQARIEKCAKKAHMSVSEAAGVILEYQLNKQDAIEEIIREKIQKAFDEE